MLDETEVADVAGDSGAVVPKGDRADAEDSDGDKDEPKEVPKQSLKTTQSVTFQCHVMTACLCHSIIRHCEFEGDGRD